jgi:hypothetical protein
VEERGGIVRGEYITRHRRGRATDHGVGHTRTTTFVAQAQVRF